MPSTGVLAAVVHWLARPGGRQDAEPLIQHRCAPPLVEFFTGDRELASELVTPQADPEREPTTAEQVERRGLPGDLHRPPARQRGNHRPDPDALGRRGDRRQRDPWIRHGQDRMPPEHMIPHEHPVPAGLSASADSRAMIAGSASSSNIGRNRPGRIIARLSRSDEVVRPVVAQTRPPSRCGQARAPRRRPPAAGHRDSGSLHAQ